MPPTYHGLATSGRCCYSSVYPFYSQKYPHFSVVFEFICDDSFVVLSITVKQDDVFVSAADCPGLELD